MEAAETTAFRVHISTSFHSHPSCLHDVRWVEIRGMFQVALHVHSSLEYMEDQIAVRSRPEMSKEIPSPDAQKGTKKTLKSYSPIIWAAKHSVVPRQPVFVQNLALLHSELPFCSTKKMLPFHHPKKLAPHSKQKSLPQKLHQLCIKGHLCGSALS